ncbi:MAG TPA: UDP binding domain-containing protein, partial [Candidatus Latescibacteria bacterium]|nr:UDP binding domain-containing protein [Candidatus Latescibacterota bacterium]
EILADGAEVRAYDPVAVEAARLLLPHDHLTYARDAYDALEGAHALILVTEWHLFRNPDFERMKSLMDEPVIFDGRNQYDPQILQNQGFRYFCVGRSQSA